MSVVAAFDVDGTLTVRDCVVPFMREVAGLNRLVSTTSRTLVPLVARRRDEVKARFCRAVFAGRDVAMVDEVASAFAGKIARSWLRQDTLARLRWHQESGHQVVLVSASLRPYLTHLAAKLEVTHLLCTDLAVEDGMYTGELDGANCRGAEKVSRLQAWAVAQGYADDWSWLAHAYGDSPGDHAMFASAGTAHDVSRGEIERSC